MNSTPPRIAGRGVSCVTFLAILAALTPVSAEVPELDRLTSQYKVEAQAALRPVQRRYLHLLEDLKRKLTLADRLEDAIEVKKEIERIEGGLGPEGQEARTPAPDEDEPAEPAGSAVWDAYIHEGVGWKGFRVGATRKELVDFMGKPDNPDDTRWLQWKRKHNMHCLIDERRGAFELRFDRGCKHRLKNGIRIGTSEKKVRAEYGKPTSVEDRGHAKKLIYGHKGILFWFAAGDVSQIVVFPVRTEAIVQHPSSPTDVGAEAP
ncbi:hypothetical protein ACFLSJ_05630 [Verrucomicrobiota bacterium]